MIQDPIPEGRGFLVYAGGPLTTSRGQTITVMESSSAEGPNVWLFADTEDLHLSLPDALRLRAALDQFIEGVPDRWERGEELLAEARRRLG